MKQLHAFLLGAGAMLAVVGFIAFAKPQSEAPVAEKKTHRVVIQMTTPDTAAYRSLTRQINNMLAKWPDAQIEVVAHNKGIGLLDKKKSNVEAEMEALKAKGIQFLACEQTLKQQKLEKSDMLPLAGFVERGLVHVVERQEAGWAYIKGGF